MPSSIFQPFSIVINMHNVLPHRYVHLMSLECVYGITIFKKKKKNIGESFSQLQEILYVIRRFDYDMDRIKRNKLHFEMQYGVVLCECVDACVCVIIKLMIRCF